MPVQSACAYCDAFAILVENALNSLGLTETIDGVCHALRLKQQQTATTTPHADLEI